MINLIKEIRTYLFSPQHKKLFSIATVIAIALAIPATAFLSQQQQTYQQRAAEESSATQINQLIQNSQNKYEIKLDLPDYLPKYLQTPQKFFSGRSIKIVKKDSVNFNSYPKAITLLKRDINTKSLISSKNIDVAKLRSDYFALTVPQDTSAGYYNIEFKRV